jgi:hypothetical protein
MIWSMYNIQNDFKKRVKLIISGSFFSWNTLKVFRSPVWLLLHKLSSPHYRYIRKIRRGDRLPLTQNLFTVPYPGPIPEIVSNLVTDWLVS